MQDFKLKAEQMWKSPATREEFNNNIDSLIAFLENQHRVKSYRGKSQNKATDTPKAAKLDDSALKARWNASKELQDEFGNFEAFRQYMLHKNRVKMMN